MPAIEAASALKSYEQVDVTVTTPARAYTKRVTLQEALRSLLGLLMADSGCPVLSPLKPLAQQHLPFSTFEETLFRVCALFSLRADFEGRADWVDDVKRLYASLAQLNRAFGARVRSAGTGDAGVNAVANLFSLSSLVEDEIDDGISALKEMLRAA